MVNSLENDILKPPTTRIRRPTVRRHREGQGRDEAVQVRHGPATASVTTRVRGHPHDHRPRGPVREAGALLAQFLEPLGMTLDVKELERGVMYNKCDDANAHTTFCAGPAWGKDYADGYTFGEPAVRLQRSLGELLQLQPARRDCRSVEGLGLRRHRGSERRRQGRRVLGSRAMTLASSAGRTSTRS